MRVCYKILDLALTFESKLMMEGVLDTPADFLVKFHFPLFIIIKLFGCPAGCMKKR